MKQVPTPGRNYSPQEIQDQEPYYWVVTLWAGDPNGTAIGVQGHRQLVTKKEDRAFELAEQWLNKVQLSDGRQLFVNIEQMAVTSSVVYVKSTENGGK